MRFLVFATAIAVLLGILALQPSQQARTAGLPCDPARPHAPGTFFDETISSGGLDRQYLLHVGPWYTGESPSTVMVALHGIGGDRFDSATAVQFAVADNEQVLVVSPQGISFPGGVVEETTGWNFPAFPDDPDDVGFISDLLDTLEAELCIDATKIYVSGVSNGALMAVRLACEMADRIAAIAPFVGVYYPPLSLDLPWANEAPCSPARPVPIITIHGTADTVIPYTAGPGFLGYNFRLGIEAATAEWAQHNGCDSVPQETQVSATRRFLYVGCSQDATVELYSVEGAEHDLGFYDGEDIFEFFAAHPLPLLGDTDGDGCSDEQEYGKDEMLGGLRDRQNPWDFYDVPGLGGEPPDGVIDLFNDILGVIFHYSLDGNPPYDANFDRGPSAGPNPWNMTAPDGVIDLFTDILGVIDQHGHACV